MLKLFFHQVNSSLGFIAKNTLSETAETVFINRLFRTVKSVQSVLKTNVKQDALNKLRFRQSEKHTEDDCTKNKFYGSVRTRCSIIAVQYGETFFIDRRINFIPEWLCPRIFKMFLFTFCKVGIASEKGKLVISGKITRTKGHKNHPTIMIL